MRPFLVLLARDIRLALREGSAVGTALGFFLLVVALMPLGLGPDLALLSRIAPGILWIGLLLAALLSLGRMFEQDHEDGTLEVLATGPIGLELVVAAKSLAHWFTTAVPLALAAPVLGLLLNLELAAYPVLTATLFVGTPAVSFLGAIGAALTLRARRGGMLVAMLVLPLYIPTLVFGISAIAAVVTPPGAFWPSFMILAAVSLVAMALAPFAAAAALRLQMQ
ncbi:MAG: heme exporter subunit [Pseudomonadota bacterium]|jgi:heme exporter protein B